MSVIRIYILNITGEGIVPIEQRSSTTGSGFQFSSNCVDCCGISTYYKLGLFVGFDDRDLIEGTFKVQPATRVANTVSVGASVVTVDSTVGFAQTGKIISGRNTIEYTDTNFYFLRNITHFITTVNFISPQFF